MLDIGRGGVVISEVTGGGKREVSFFVIRIIFETGHISCFTTCEQY